MTPSSHSTHSSHSTWARVRHHLRAGAKIILIISAFVVAGEYFGWFDQFEKGATDWLVRLGSFKEVSREIVVVGIGENDFREKFQSASPLPQQPLLELVQKLAQDCPAVIGIDIVNGPPFQPQGTASCGHPPQVVYAATASRIDVARGHRPGFLPWFLGRQIPVVELEGGPATTPKLSGLPVLPLDRDGMVRSYTRLVRAEYPAPRPGGDIRSFNAAVLEAYCEVLKERGLNHQGCEHFELEREAFLFGVWGEDHIPPLDASEVLLQGSGPQSNSPLRDKIVLVGGKFAASRDSYSTPQGTYYGVDLLALAIDSDLHHYAVSEIHPWMAVIWDLLMGAAIVMLFAVLRLVPAFYISMAGTIALSILVSVFLFHVRSYFLNFMVVGVGVIIHQLFMELEKLKDLEQAEARIRALEKELEARPAALMD